MYRLTISKQTERKIASGIQLLDRPEEQELPDHQGLVDLISQKGTYLGRAYLSPQNKGMGWFLSTEPVTLDVAYFVSLFEVAKAKRQAYALDPGTTAYRLFNQDGDDFGGLTVDRYGDFALFSWYNTFVYSLKEVIVAAFSQVFPELLGAYDKCRFQGGDSLSGHLYGQEAPETFIVLENGVSYSVFLNDGLMTGIFLDQHEVRGRLVDGLAAGQSLLNLFSYTAAFSVAAAMGGASQTTSVDLAKRSRDLSRAHFDANGLDMANHGLVVMDVFDYFDYARKKGLSYDVIILDPPSFARNKKRTFSVAKDYHKLVSASLDLLKPGGTIIASTNASNLSLAAFKKQLAKGMGQQAHRFAQVQQLPADFAVNPNDESSNYLKVVTIEVNP